ncbi:MAG: Protein ArsC [Phycisphaerae bacterium]|nr:Protein ArsC [Phycisphaerae bacterium]
MKSIAVVLFLSAVLSFNDPTAVNTAPLNPELAKYVQTRAGEFEQIPTERQTQLKLLADNISKQLQDNQSARLVFVCTHNSRRSHLAQIWAATAAEVYGFTQVQTFSGGTEATAFNPRAVAALQRAGFIIERTGGEDNNPVYTVKFSLQSTAMDCFSKRYDQPPNPTADFTAIMVCSQADKQCPLVNGAIYRQALPYDDPKAADDTPEEQQRYDERCAQIAREMMYVMSQVKSTTK